MKKIIVAFFAIAFMACNNEKTTEATAEAKASVPTKMYGFTPGYSASFVMDDATNTETVLALWEDWKKGDLSPSRSRFADSLSLFLADGTSMIGLTDTLLKNMQAYRSSFKGMEVAVDAIFATKSIDKNEDWVAVWGTEVQTNMNGKVDSVSLQEIWRFNKAGKVDMMVQAVRKGILPPPPPTK
jgi:hypothetical protein